MKLLLDKKINIEEINLDFLEIISYKNNLLEISYEKSKVKIEEVISYIHQQNANISDISTDEANLEDVFMRLTKN